MVVARRMARRAEKKRRFGGDWGAGVTLGFIGNSPIWIRFGALRAVSNLKMGG
jgi:hypothetical protein